MIIAFDSSGEMTAFPGSGRALWKGSAGQRMNM